MSEFKYEYLLTEGIYVNDGETHKGYGISIADRSNIPGIFVTYDDISTNKEKVENLIFLCNKLELYPVHLNDVIEDFFL